MASPISGLRPCLEVDLEDTRCGRRQLREQGRSEDKQQLFLPLSPRILNSGPKRETVL